MNTPTILGSLVIFGILAAILFPRMRRRKSAKAGCSSCGGCPYSEFCHGNSEHIDKSK